jgi:DNA-directed RNA polymerase specialized sigma24 family protein
MDQYKASLRLFKMNDSSPRQRNSDPPTRDVRFQPTQWTLVLRARQQGNALEAQSAIEALCKAYWYPLYAFARKQGFPPHDAQDLTQGFFAYLLQKDLFAAADRNLGKLRTFLLTAFTRFISRERAHESAGKRGGGRPVESLDQEFENGERRYRLEPADRVTPEQIYACSWALSILDVAKAQIQAKEAAAGRSEMFKVLEPFLEQNRDSSISYESVSAKLGTSQEALRKAVSRLRERYRDAVRDQIASTLRAPTEEEIESEMRALRAALS